VFLDSKCLQDGVDWEVGFCDGLVRSRCFVPVLSRAGIEARFAALHEDSYCDNVLLEYRLAVELQRRGLVQRLFPVFVGDEAKASFGYDKYYPAPTASQSHVVAVEDKLRQHLDRQGLGAPIETRPSVAQVLGRITKCQGGFVVGEGSLEALLAPLADRVKDMANPPAVAAAAGGGGGGGGGGGVAAPAPEIDVSLEQLVGQLSNLLKQPGFAFD